MSTCIIIYCISSHTIQEAPKEEEAKKDEASSLSMSYLHCTDNDPARPRH